MALPKIFIKDGVKINGAHFLPEAHNIVMAVRETAPEMSDKAIWITSGNDSNHKANSLHYKDRAFDFRVWNIKDYSVEKVLSWRDRVKAKLGKDYDILFEEAPPHIHCEWDPKV